MKISPTFIVLLIEFAVALSVIVGVFVFVAWRRNRLVNVAAQRATEHKAAAEPARQEDLYAALREALAGEDEVIRQKAEEIIQSERVFHDRIITAFRTRDKEAIDKLDNWTEDLVQPYRSLITEVSTPGNDETKAINEKLNEMEETVEALTEERDRIKEELKNKEKEVESMVGEYVSAFNEKGAAPPAGDEAAAGEGPPGAPPAAPDQATPVMTNNTSDKDAAAAGDSQTRAAAAPEDAGSTDDRDLDEEIEAFLDATEQPTDAAPQDKDGRQDAEQAAETPAKAAQGKQEKR